MTREELEASVLASTKFRDVLSQLGAEAVRADLPAVDGHQADRDVDWNFALLCSSALTSSSRFDAQAAVLRVAQACLVGDDLGRREAAAALLERLGNGPTLELAARRDLIARESWTELPAPLQLDVMHRRLELTIFPEDRPPIAANPFQRAFWTAAASAQWISVSAPTSAGKSFIVKRWIEERARTTDEFRAVYVVPTRALIDEVSRDLRHEMAGAVAVHTLPWDALVGAAPREVFVLTQERLHLLQQRVPGFAPSVVFIDEAQKFGDSTRGVLLAQVLDEAVRRSPNAQVIFASPLASNPEALLRDAPAQASRTFLMSDMVTVSQNLLWADQVQNRPQRWRLRQVSDGQSRLVGEFDLPARPSPPSKRLPYVAVVLGGLQPGNVVYVNRAADAETTALQIYETLGPEADVSDRLDIQALRDLAITSVHRQYALGTVVARGVAFHYGNIPQLLRSEIERLFREGVLRYLVCTSTLLEGVNLPCRNLFARGPKKGNARPMTLSDFWNLAGRAGRWGIEFQGNIVCVDAADTHLWPSAPTARVREPIARTTDRILEMDGALTNYIRRGTPVADARADPDLEAVFSLLATRVAQGRGLDSVQGVSLGTELRATLEDEIGRAIAEIELDPAILDRHAGISPLSLQRLLDELRQIRDIESYVLAPPESRDAAESYVRALALIDNELGGGFGAHPGRHFQLAILLTQWMRGQPLSVLINDRINYRRRNGVVNVAAEIRAVMSDVEQFARFQAPKYLAAYADVLNYVLRERGIPVPDYSFDLSVMLELGVSRTTDVSLMSLGLSRTATVALSAYVVRDDLSPELALEWLRSHDTDRYPITALVRREIRELLA